MKLCPHCSQVYDRPEDDATDAAHPAWWRGHDHGSLKVAELLFRVCLEGATVGAHYAAPVAQVVLAIEALRSLTRAHDTALREWQDEAAKQLGRVIELEKLIDEVDGALELTVDQLARMQPAWKVSAARAFGRWVARMAAEQQR
jgi:hypothetical protein